jgi:hypothetical protein
MKNKFNIYCSFACLREIYDQCTKPISDFVNGDNIAIWVNLYILVYEKSQLFIDLTDEELHKLTKENPFFNKLFKEDKIIAVAENFQKIGKEDTILQKIPPKTLFFLDKTPIECKNLEDDFGLIFISKEELSKKATWLFSWAVRNVQKKNGNHKNWDFLKKFRHPCNALLLADNHILNDKRLWKENLLSVLQNLLPERLNKQIFELTIFREVIKTPNANQLLKNEFDELEAILKQTFDYEINLTIIPTYEIHDRNILTNYAWFNSGYGFNLFKNGIVEKSTTITFLPFSYLNTDYQKYDSLQVIDKQKINVVAEIVTSFLDQFKNINDKSENSSDNKIIWFTSNCSKQNRLLR